MFKLGWMVPGLLFLASCAGEVSSPVQGGDGSLRKDRAIKADRPLPKKDLPAKNEKANSILLYR